MEILTIIIILIVVWFIFKIVIPAFKMTFGTMDEIGEASKYVDANHPIVKNANAMSRLKYVIKKYRKKGYSEKKAMELALKEFEDNPDSFLNV